MQNVSVHIDRTSLWQRTPDRNTIVIDQALASKAFPSESFMGKRILFRIRTPEPEWGEIVGVVAHQRDTSLAEPGREQLDVTYGYGNYGGASGWAPPRVIPPAMVAMFVKKFGNPVGNC